ncbi:MAG: diaminopimelate dehydrogenase, partial [Ruminococcus sp.]|nr:diaminopimelate dehydrogenase [Ruminococcus sp.]
MSKLRIGIAGYGNLGKGVELAIRQNDDMELAGIFTRRDPASLKPLTEGAPVFSMNDIQSKKDDIDVLIICGGSATDLPKQTPELAQYFNVIDSFDTHARIPEHFANVDKAAKESGHLAFISLGWDPGLFSLNRLYAESILPNGKSYTFWGKGVSQGHSDAIRRVEGVKRGIQYTVPIESAMEAVRSGSQPDLTTREKHLRECWVVPEEGADLAKIEESIKTMKNYFD